MKTHLQDYVFILLFSLLSGVVLAGNHSPTDLQVGNASWKKGIRKVEKLVSQDPDTLELDFVHKKRKRSGHLRISRIGENQQFFYELHREKSPALEIEWNLETGALRMWLPNGAAPAWSFTSNGWVSADAGADRYLKQYSSDIELVGVLTSDSFDAINTLQVATLGKGRNPGDTPWRTCYICDHTQRVQGKAFDTSRSWCCYEAKNRANNKCSNSYCWGCCDLLECNAICLVGDAFCGCGMFGFKCDACP